MLRFRDKTQKPKRKKKTLKRKKKHFQQKTRVFYGKNPAQWVKWVYTRVHTQANPGYLSDRLFNHAQSHQLAGDKGHTT